MNQPIDSKPNANDYSPDAADAARMKEITGNVMDDRQLVTFLYLLARDHLPIGTIEQLIDTATTGDRMKSFCNGFLAMASQDQFQRLVPYYDGWRFRSLHGDPTTLGYYVVAFRDSEDPSVPKAGFGHWMEVEPDEPSEDPDAQNPRCWERNSNTIYTWRPITPVAEGWLDWIQSPAAAELVPRDVIKDLLKRSTQG